jgi:hypothetical protein
VTADDREQVLAILPAGLAAAARAWTAPPQRNADSRVREVRLAGHLSAATVRAYVGGWNAFSSWCSGQTPPASAERVAVYLAGAVYAGYRTATILRWASSISAVHTTRGYPDPCARTPAREVIAALRALRDEPVRRARPLLADDLLELLAWLPGPGWPAEPARRRDRLIVTLGFAAGLGPSGLVGLTLGDFEPVPGEHALRLARNPGQVIAAPGGPVLACAPCAYTSWRELIDTVDEHGSPAAVRTLTGSADTPAREHLNPVPAPVTAARSGMPLLRRIRRGGTVTADPLTAQVIGQVLRSLAVNAGLDPRRVSGLSLRASNRLEDALMDASAARQGAR